MRDANLFTRAGETVLFEVPVTGVVSGGYRMLSW
jgi:hypothetical protein